MVRSGQHFSGGRTPHSASGRRAIKRRQHPHTPVKVRPTGHTRRRKRKRKGWKYGLRTRCTDPHAEFPALPFSAGADTRSCKAGLLTRSRCGAFPVREDQWLGLPQQTSRRMRSSQQRELLPIHTAFPFHSPARGNHCAVKIGLSAERANALRRKSSEKAVEYQNSGNRGQLPPPGVGLARILPLKESAAGQQPQ